ncbi:MAG: hypothetical protein PHP57_05635 [Sideroxydans sp.]|nr:hypothetical protein [Sideroxydans sp.]
MDTATFTRIAKAVASANHFRLGEIDEPSVVPQLLVRRIHLPHQLSGGQTLPAVFNR